MLLCCTTDVSLEFPTIYQHFCLVPLVFRFHWKICIFLYFLFLKDSRWFHIVTWTWFHWCRSKFHFYNSLSSMLYLTCAKTLLLRHLLFKGRLDLFIQLHDFCLTWWLWVCQCLVMDVDSWFHVFHIVSVEDFWKLMVWWKMFLI